MRTAKKRSRAIIIISGGGGHGWFDKAVDSETFEPRERCAEQPQGAVVLADALAEGERRLEEEERLDHVAMKSPQVVHVRFELRHHERREFIGARANDDSAGATAASSSISSASFFASFYCCRAWVGTHAGMRPGVERDVVVSPRF